MVRALGYSMELPFIKKVMLSTAYDMKESRLTNIEH